MSNDRCDKFSPVQTVKSAALALITQQHKEVQKQQRLLFSLVVVVFLY
jgi:hypothetical protein